ncbi:alpha-amylase family glycosyl hydrolase [Ideonella sp. BN130291]|uniref:alpha-amylase family glycosyl hydrolase n=1 Tax=Ideonella sp. BN130291 TaxID=3112940 RepID=UPI002E269A2D|nr:alpha-amylase family glycosyl hydrolase [Ideonella sp. BN130291]
MRSFLAGLLLTAAFAASAATASTKPMSSDCTPAPLGDTALYLRGGMNNWTASDDHEFQWSCDAYYLNVNLQQRLEFKIGDAAWRDASTFGAAAGGGTIEAAAPFALARADSRGGAGNLVFTFSGEHTLRLALDGGAARLTIGPKSFIDRTREPITDPVALSLHHDSRDLRDKSPFGAVTAGTTVSFGVAARPGVRAITLVIEKRRLEGNQELLEYSPVARVPMQLDGHGRWTARHAFDAPSVYGYYFEAQIGDKTYVLHNNRDSVPWTREKGSNGTAAVELMPSAPHRIRRLRHTVYAADFEVPAWAQDAVYYYIFPERFRNGDRRNDPKPGTDRYQDKGVEFHTEWLDKPHRPGSGDGSDDVYNNDFFGGDLAGIIDKLDYIAGLGVNTIYMTPVFTAASNHKYDTADYRNIDPHFGSNAEFTRLCDEAAKRGIRVVPDASLNHTGADSIYFNRFGNHGQQGAFQGGKIRPDSPYADWYSFDTTQAEADKQFKGWVGVTDLPELNKQSAGFRRFAYGEGGVMQLWLDRGAAGWRMDVAPWVPDDFWREWRRAIKAHKPDAITIAETWFEASKFFLGDSFDSTMNYVFRNALLDYAAGGKAGVLAANLELMRELYPPQAFHAVMNLLSTHDAARSLHVLGWTPEVIDPAKIAEAKQRMKLAVFFQMTYPGAPAVYYGDEVGVTGGDDPYNRATYPWADLGGKPDTGMLEEFKRLIGLRKEHAVLRRGQLQAPLHVDDHVLVLARRLGDTWAVTATNNDTVAHSVQVKLPDGAPGVWRELLTGQAHRSDGGTLSIQLPPLAGSALLRQP